MTTFWRTLLLIVSGLGATWAATRIGGAPPTVFNTLDEGTPVAAPPAAADEPGPGDIETQIRKAEQALGDRADPEQELPVDPLRADVAISLPSDI